MAQWIGEPIPDDLDGVSFLPTLVGRSEEQKPHPYLYWEFYEQGSRQAVRFGNWKAIREPMLTGPIQLYDLSVDEAESNNLAESNPELVNQAKAMMNQAHRPDPRWSIPKNKK
jgi:uncharacterized sulfatase